MKTFLSLTVAGCLAVGAGAAHADGMSLNQFAHRELPVLVQVDSHGIVTRASPAIELTPRFDRLLRETLGELITRPAMHHGQPIASQFVMRLGMQTKQRPDGNYDASFVYRSASPVPAGQWAWRLEDGHRLALVSQGSVHRFHYVSQPPLRDVPVPLSRHLWSPEATPARAPAPPPPRTPAAAPEKP